ncbi:hypothetical protein ACO2Q0_00245 [Phenylobacterium sp. VNQ135]|uniref:hypothetical protein n=1 Tax=Phenylobacterium sp. VNQ135 TaxID=3400922 RepID=UPI003C08C30A
MQSTPSLVDPANLILYSVALDQLTLTDGLAGYGDETDPLLPVGELTRLLEMEVDVRPPEGRIIGRVGEARRALVVDLKTGTARDGPREVKLAPDDVAVTATEIFIKASTLQQLLPLELKVDPAGLAIMIVAKESLPIQARQERAARIRDLGVGRSITDTESLIVDRPYGLIGWPGFDIQVASGVQSEDPQTPLRYDVRTAADLLYGNFQGYIGSDETGSPSSARAVFERRSLRGGLLGPLKARVVAVGDVFTPTLSLGPRGVGGRGFMLSTVPLDHTNVFNRVDLRGELPIGYDVELYINDVLRSGQNTPAEGRYEFLNVPLSPGVNVVRIVTYGPRGERSEQTRIINVGGGMLRRGEVQFELGAVQQNRDVIVFARPDGSPRTDVRGYRAVTSVNYGLTQSLTLSAGAALLPLAEDKYRMVYNAGFRTSLFGFATQVDAAADDRGAYGGFLGVAGDVAGASVVLRHAEFRRGFLDENGPGFELTRPTRRRTELSADATLDLRQRLIPISGRLSRYQYEDGTTTYLGSLRGSSSIGSFLVSSGFEYEHTESATSTIQRLTGYLAASTFRDYAWQIRATIDYDILPEFAARTLAITADRDITPTWAVRVGVGQPLDDFDATNLVVASVHRLKIGDLALQGEYNNSDQSYRLGAQLSFGLNNVPGEGYRMTRSGPGSGGSVLFHAFMDDNGNGAYDEGEAPVKDVVLEGGLSRAKTGADGKAFISGVGAGPTSRLAVNLEQLENPLVKTPPTTLDLRPRPGATLTVDYPMQPTGDVVVKLLLRRPDGQTVGLAAARLVLSDDKGRTYEAGTEFDGTAVFSQVPVGSYRVELEPDQAKRLRMRLAAPLTAVVKNDGGFGTDVQGEVVFESRTQEQAPAAEDLSPQSDQVNN